MARTRTKKETFLVKPSKLPKDKKTSVRYNSFIKEQLEKEGYSLQSLLDEAIDKKLPKVEYEKKLTIEPKKLK
jgi:hypothetical protein